jgi:hypothetical protein
MWILFGLTFALLQNKMVFHELDLTFEHIHAFFKQTGPAFIYQRRMIIHWATLFG